MLSRLLRAAAVLTVVVGAAAACGQSQDEAATGQVSVANHALVTRFTERGVISVYIGQWRDDPASSVTVAGGALERGQDLLSDRAMEYVGERAFTQDGQSCSAKVLRLRKGGAPQPNWKLTADQSTSVTSGDSELLHVTTSCGSG